MTISISADTDDAAAWSSVLPSCSSLNYYPKDGTRREEHDSEIQHSPDVKGSDEASVRPLVPTNGGLLVYVAHVADGEARYRAVEVSSDATVSDLQVAASKIWGLEIQDGELSFDGKLLMNGDRRLVDSFIKAGALLEIQLAPRLRLSIAWRTWGPFRMPSDRIFEVAVVRSHHESLDSLARNLKNQITKAIKRANPSNVFASDLVPDDLLVTIFGVQHFQNRNRIPVKWVSWSDIYHTSRNLIQRVRLSKLDAGEFSHQDWSVGITCLRYPLTVSML